MCLIGVNLLNRHGKQGRINLFQLCKPVFVFWYLSTAVEKEMVDFQINIFTFLFTYLLLLDVNECSSNPCFYGGTCYDKFGGYVCACRKGFEGSNCQIGELYRLPKVHLLNS